MPLTQSSWVRSSRGQTFRGLVAAAALAALLAGCAEPPAPPPPPPPAAPMVSLSPKLVAEAAAYRRYMSQATAITPDFSSGESVAASLQVGVAYEPGQLVRGAIAYAAISALQDPAYVEGVQAYAKDPDSRRKIAYEIIKDPAYAVGLPDSAGAAGLIIASLGGEAQRLYAEGKAVKQSAYDIQRSSWSKADVPARDLRLTRAKSLSTAAMMGDVAETARLQQASTGAAALGLSAAPVAPPYTPLVIRGLAVAALAALGEAGEGNLETLMSLAVEPNVSSCMGMSKLNLYQCLAVARPHYEDVFCLGQHAMMDTGRCLIQAAGLTAPEEPRFVPDASSINRGMADDRTDRKKPRRR